MITDTLRRSLRRLRLPLLVLAGAVVAGAVSSLDRVADGSSTARAPAAPRPSDGTPLDAALRPEPARWRIASPADMERVLLPLSQILISHHTADRGLSLVGDPLEQAWLRRETPVATRTREQALHLAQQIARTLAARPEAFEALAARHSDDLASQALGGRLGSLTAASLHPVVLDAVFALAPGQVSQIVETSYGFHLWKLERAPARAVVGGRRVVLPYVGSALSEREPKAPLPTRAQAFALARQLVARARKQPAAFLELGRALAPSTQPLLTGEVGVWSTHDVGDDRRGGERAIDLLSRLSPSAISEPIDGPYGVEIWQRADDVTTTRHAYEALFFSYDPEAAASSTRSKAHALGMAHDALSELREHPERFGALQERYCCKTRLQWTSGFVEPGLAELLAQTPMDTIAAQPWVDPYYVAVVRRVEPTAERRAEAVAFALPRPKAPDIAALVEHGDGTQLARATRELSVDASAALGLIGERARGVQAVLGRLAEGIEASPPGAERMLLFSRSMSELERVLGAELYQRYLGYMNNWATARLLHGR